MYWFVTLFIVAAALAVSGLFGVFPVGIVLALVVAAGAVIFFVLSGRENPNVPQVVAGRPEPTGQVRGSGSRFSTSSDGETANERVGQP